MTNIVMVSDFEFDRAGMPTTGYSNIAVMLGNELTKKGHKVIGFGFSYGRQEHNSLFGINAMPVPHLPMAVNTLMRGIQLSRLIYVLDVPLIEHLTLAQAQFGNPPEHYKSIGIFAVESDPLCLSWAISLSRLNYRFPISQFGTEEVLKMGLDAQHYPVPINLETWRMREPGQKEILKEALGLKDKYVMFVNADGNERKNISAVLEGLKIATQTNPNLHMLLLTRKNFHLAWKFDDLINFLGIQKNISIIDRGIPQSDVWNLYAAADSFWNMSKCEGLGLPILEAMAVGVPCVATDATAMRESLQDGRGMLLKPDYKWIDPFGNTNRYFVFPDKIADAMLQMATKTDDELKKQVDDASKYVRDRTVNDAVGMIEKLL